MPRPGGSGFSRAARWRSGRCSGRFGGTTGDRWPPTCSSLVRFSPCFGARYSWVWDHWQYLADLGPLAFIAAGVAWLHDYLAPRFRLAVRCGAVVVLGVLGVLS